MHDGCEWPQDSAVRSLWVANETGADNDVINARDNRWLRNLLPFLLCTAEGILIGFFTVSLPNWLIGKGSGAKTYDITALILFGFSLKLVWGPLVDCFVHSAMGRRR